MDKYKTVIPWMHSKQSNQRELQTGEGKVLATFYDVSMAQKVCDLLNETSRSQGKYPKRGT